MVVESSVGTTPARVGTSPPRSSSAVIRIRTSPNSGVGTSFACGSKCKRQPLRSRIRSSRPCAETPMIDRRNFLKRAGLVAGGLPLAACATLSSQGPAADRSKDPWQALREQFPLDASYIHFANFLLSAHCTPVRNAIARFRDRLDANPALVVDYEREEVWQ